MTAHSVILTPRRRAAGLPGAFARRLCCPAVRLPHAQGQPVRPPQGGPVPLGGGQVADQTLPVVVPDNLKLVSDDDLEQFKVDLTARRDALGKDDTVTPDSVAESVQIGKDYQRVKAELRGRAVARAEAAEAEAKRLEAAQAEALASMSEEDARSVTVTPTGEVIPAAPAVDPEAIAAASARGTVAALSAMGVKFPNGMRPDAAAAQATTALAAAAIRTQPRDQLPTRRLAVTASVDIPGYAGGQELTTEDALVEAVQKRAKAMPVSRDGDNARGAVVATIHNEFDHTVDERHQPSEVGELFDELRSRQNQEALLAGGGWCAPSEIRYDFFQIADPPDGIVDLPTVGVTRGGIRYPTSPSLADVFANSAGGLGAFGGFSTTFSSPSVPFLWTESDDIATVTGTPNKPTVRVPCPSFAEQRLECYGFQVT